MANTEGMSDEFIQSLAMTPSTSMKTAETTPTPQERRRRRFQERMDMPLGDTPAAKVIVKSSNSKSSNDKTKIPSTGKVRSDVDSERRAQATASQSLSTVENPMIGEIVEHTHKRPTKKAGSNSRSRTEAGSGGGGGGEGKQSRPASSFSRFSQRKQQQQGDPSTCSTATGFPSLDVPIGSFARKKSNKKNMATSSKSNNTATATNFKVEIDDKAVSANKNNDVQEASRKDADTMLSNLSLDEIRQYQQEIQSSLSPDMIAFLKRRGYSGGGSSRSESGNNKSDNDHNSGKIRTNRQDDSSVMIKDFANEKTTAAPALTSDAGTNPSQDDKAIKRQKKSFTDEDAAKRRGREEKERLANIIASVRSHEDLDTVYKMEMQQPHPLTQDDVDGGGDNEDEDVKKKLSSGHEDGDETFHVACDLLRSTSRRQTLWAARTVSLRLLKMIEVQKYSSLAQQDTRQDLSGYDGRAELPATSSSPSSLPIILSVSFRCLLDKPTSAAYLLHTYALQGLYSLSLLYSWREDGSALSSFQNEQTYQLYFMDDAVPTRSMQETYAPVNVQPLNIDGSVDNASEAKSAAAYATSTATTSALTDAQSFTKDPMWTLLSKMRILPRLSFLVREFDIPEEAWIAICRLLEMLGRRSPGAASAIVQHEHLIPNIHRRILQELHNRSHSEGRINVTVSALRMFCVLARQTKVAAENLPLEELLPPLLALNATRSDEFHAQQLALVMWRTSLRYGLGLPALASMLTFSARSLALPYSNQYSLSSDFVAGFAEVLECTRIISSKTPDMIFSATKQNRIDEKILPVVENSAKYLYSVINHLLPASSTPTNPVDDDRADLDSAARYRWNGARLSFLSSWIHLTSTVNKGNNTLVALPPSLSVDNKISILEALNSWADVGEDIEEIWRIIVKTSLVPTGTVVDNKGKWTDASLAAGCAFLKGFLSVVSAFSLSESHNDHIRGLKQSLDQTLTQLFLDVERAVKCSEGGDNALHKHRVRPLSSVHNGWLIQGHYAVAKFLVLMVSTSRINSSSDLTVVRSIVFSLLGRLQRGDEAVAAVLFSADVLYQTSSDAVNDSIEGTTPSPLSSMFLGELCGSDRERVQLDHSFKLHHGFGITSDGFGHFGLESLLSTAYMASPPPLNPSKKSNISEVSVLPLDRLWLWQTLSGSIRVNSGNVMKGTEEARNVIRTTLDLLLELEEGEEIANIVGYSSSIQSGSKLYYVMNVCLQPEDIIRDNGINSAAETIVRRYLQHFGRDDGLIFCRECFCHSNTAKPASDADTFHDGDNRVSQLEDVDETSSVKGYKILENYLHQEQDPPIGETAVTVPVAELKALEAFVEDLCTAYKDYGAQYTFFAQCIRVFLLPVFPDSVRRRVVQELEGMLHTLTFPEKDDMKELVQKSMLGGLPDVDRSHRDSPVILDAITTAIARSQSLSRPLQGYTLHLSVALLARSLSIGISSNDQAAISMSKRRLQRLPSKMIVLICEVADSFLEEGGTVDALVNAVDVIVSNPVSTDSTQISNNDDTKVEPSLIDECVDKLMMKKHK